MRGTLFIIVLASLPFLAVTMMISNALNAAPEQGNKRGFIQNEEGTKCWYNQTLVSGQSYFHKKGMTDTQGLIEFDNSECMEVTDINKRMINNVITRWYSFPDANFATRANEMYRTSMFQVRGRCIQSRKYEIIGVLVDYLGDGKHISKVIHGVSVQGCKK